MTDDTLTTADKLAMLVGGGLVVLATVVLGFVNDVLLGAPPTVVEEEGQIVATPVIDPHLRGGIALLGLVVFLLYAIYKIVGVPPADPDRTGVAPERAD